MTVLPSLSAPWRLRRSSLAVQLLAPALLAALGCSDTSAPSDSAGAGGGGGAGMNGSGAGGAAAGAGGGSSGAASGAGGALSAGGSAGAAGTAGLAAGGGGAGGSAGEAGSGGSAGGSGGSAGAGDPTCNAGVWDQSTPEVLSLSGNTFAHDPTMIKVGSTFYRFWTGNHIPSATSTNLTNWSNAPTVYDGSYPAWVSDWLDGVSGETFNFPWAPDVSAFNGDVHIYSSFSAKFGDNISCITHLSTSDITSGDWTDHGPVICTQGNEDYNAIDADVGIDQTDGTPYLAFGSFWSGIKAIRLNPDGSRAGTDMASLAWANEIEAPVLFYRCGYYYLFVTWGLCCPGEGRSIEDLSYRVAVGRSENILGPYVDKNGVEMLDGGGTLIVEGDGVAWAAAGHSDVIVEGANVYHLYHAYAQSNGNASLRIAELWFDDEGWPVPHAP